jgi:hypothetical protein
MTKKIVNGVIEDMTPEELSQKEIDKTNNEAEIKAYEEVKQAKKTAQANGNQKLLDLGLTQAEATALTGYTPPVAE